MQLSEFLHQCYGLLMDKQAESLKIANFVLVILVSAAISVRVCNLLYFIIS